MLKISSILRGSVQGSYTARRASSSGRQYSVVRNAFYLAGAATVGFSALVVYGKYDPRVKQFLVNYVPYMKSVLETDKEKVAPHASDSLPLAHRKANELKKRIIKETEKIESEKVPAKYQVTENKVDSRIINSTSESSGLGDLSAESFTYEKLVTQLLEELRIVSDGAIKAENDAVESIKHHTKKLYEAVDLSEDYNDDLRTEAKKAVLSKEQALNKAKARCIESKKLIEKVRESIEKLSAKDPNNNIVKSGRKSVDQLETKLNMAESEVSAAEALEKIASEYKHLVEERKEEFEKELKIVLPHYARPDKNKNLPESDLNVLIAHAHSRIEKLQKELAKQKISEKSKIEEAVKNQREESEGLMESRLSDELQKKNLTPDSAVESKVSALKAKLESDFHKQLLRQAAAHADHLKEALNIQAHELDRKHILDVEEKLLNMKGKFVTEIASNSTRMKGFLEYLKAKKEFDKSSKAFRELWLICEALNDKIRSSMPESGNRSWLSKDLAAIKVISNENKFIGSVLSILSEDVVEKGVSNRDALKFRFQNVKNVCKKVALIDDNNDSLFRYFLSYFQSLLILDDSSGISDELNGKVAVNPKEFDTFDVLNRVSICLDRNDFEQSLRYANLLKGEAKYVAEGWIKELTTFLETELVVKVLVAYAASINIQAYH